MDQKKEDGRDETGENRLGKEGGEKQGIEMAEGSRIENAKKGDEEETFHHARDEDKQKLG